MTSASVVFVIGTRAQLIKVAPVIRACEQAGLPTHLLMTGQHRDTMDDLLHEFAIAAPRRAAVPAGENATVGALLGFAPRALAGLIRELRALQRIEGALDVLVHGDTLSTLLGALAARRVGARVLHVESGLTSAQLLDPFPEELTRRLVFRLTDVAFCPGPREAMQMRRYRCEVVETQGNTILDAVRMTGALQRAMCPSGQGVLVSLHRFQNLYSARRFDRLMGTVAALAEHRDVHFVLHPATHKRLERSRWPAVFDRLPRLRRYPRMGYRAFLCMAAEAECVLTDGGSNQEELACLGVPTVIMRQTTERQDGLGANALMERDLPADLVDWVCNDGPAALRRPPRWPADPGPSARIVRYLSGLG
ncbi:UDP-N-acetylglucosamine 2-epimerase (non-hydrolysing) [Fontimonas thermophila]|uniref:UDP-N-acetylglucosamine 2-epimerase (Non-hydrolysing) n=1 Tax=Fontimonas thermophila TaxID=1076937 RepID=A0A1I2K112_9GAMM|nr:UDP-N-acetylglucosamine 2-epimerase [Fontimonas thermophila]SFF60802.1 UDP-N-acetylglucosamine 2-epimerase (non-hydrolysing) [Fontimonas thermophila]